MSEMRKSKGDATHDITNKESDAEVVGLPQMFYAPVGVLWVETMISQVAGQSRSTIHNTRSVGVSNVDQGDR